MYPFKPVFREATRFFRDTPLPPYFDHWCNWYLRCVLVCNTRLTAFSGVVESPNYPYSYDSETNCEWVVQTTVGNTINASFTQFELQPAIRGTCSADYVEVLVDTVSPRSFETIISYVCVYQ